MYSRFQNRPDEEIHIPEHYSGCAFSQPSPGPEKKREEPIKPRSHPPEATRPSPPPPPGVEAAETRPKAGSRHVTHT
jgi:hypothetical protein